MERGSVQSRSVSCTEAVAVIARMLTLFAVLVTLPAAAGTDRQTARQLYDQLSVTPEVRVIVTLDVPDGTRGAGNKTSKRIPRPSGRLRYGARQDALINQLNTGRKIRKGPQYIKGQQKERIKKFKYVPQMAMSVDREDLEQLLNDPSVRVQRDIPRELLLDQSVPAVYPNHLTNDALDGNGWVVAVLDTGIDSDHPFLTGKVVSEACYSAIDGLDSLYTTSLCPAEAASSTATGSGESCDETIPGCEHGTFVGGIIAGGDDGTITPPLNGVAKSADLISIKVVTEVDATNPSAPDNICDGDSECLKAWTTNIIAGLERVYELRNDFDIAAVNLSVGEGKYTGTCDDQPEKEMIDLLHDVGIATIVATGNGSNANSVVAPACVSTAVAVGATSDTDGATPTRTWYSNTSTELDLYAPGSFIQSSSSIAADGGYKSEEGTSLAAAHVAGAWAVLKQQSPQASVSGLRQLFQDTGDTVSNAGGYADQQINIDSALAAAPESTPPLSLATTMMNADEDGSGTVSAGDTITLIVAATNTGGVNYIGVEVSNNLTTPATITCPILSDGNSCTLTGTYTVTSADETIGELVSNSTTTASGGFLAIVDSLTIPFNSNPAEDDSLCFPVKASNGKVAVICL